MVRLARVQGPWLGAGVGGLCSAQSKARPSRHPRGGGRDTGAAGEAGWLQGHVPPAGLAGCVRHRLAGRSQLLNHRRTLTENTVHIYGDSEFESQFLPGSAQQFPWQVTLGTPCAVFNHLRLEDSGHLDTEEVLKSYCKYISFNDSGKIKLRVNKGRRQPPLLSL